MTNTQQTNVTVNLELSSYPDYCHELEDNIEGATITKKCLIEIYKAKNLLKSNKYLSSITLNFEPEIGEDSDNILTDDSNVKYNIGHIIVYEYGIYWCLQGKWDCFFQIEYSLTFNEKD